MSSPANAGGRASDLGQNAHLAVRLAPSNTTFIPPALAPSNLDLGELHELLHADGVLSLLALERTAEEPRATIRVG